MAPQDSVLEHALMMPSIKKLKGKRVVLASASPRRKEILSRFVPALSFVFLLGLTQREGYLPGGRTVHVRGEPTCVFVRGYS